MKLTMAMAAALVLCGGSLVARASILHKREVAQAASAAAAEAAQHTPARESERAALGGIDARLGARLHRMAVAHR